MRELKRMFRLYDNYEPRERRQVILNFILEIECIWAVLIAIIAALNMRFDLREVGYAIEQFFGK